MKSSIIILLLILLQSCNDQEESIDVRKDKVRIFAVEWDSFTRRNLLPDNIIDSTTENITVYDVHFIDSIKAKLTNLQKYSPLYFDARIVCLIYTEKNIDTLTLSQGHGVRYNSTFYKGDTSFSNFILNRLTKDYQTSTRKFGFR